MTHAAAGFRMGRFLDEAQGADIPYYLFYPSDGVEAAASVGQYSFTCARAAAPIGAKLRLIALSHGNSGTPMTHRALASMLARAGLVVVAPEHVGNSRSDNSLANRPENLVNRPRQLVLSIRAALKEADIGPRIDSSAIGAVGHSIGAYTALAAAGARPRAEAPDGRSMALETVHDSRLRALALLAPATPWLRHHGALDLVTAAIFLRSGEMDKVTPRWHADIVAAGARNARSLDDAVVKNAGHFSFQSLFPVELTRADFPPSQDPPGFDRHRYEQQLAQELTAFFAAAL